MVDLYENGHQAKPDQGKPHLVFTYYLYWTALSVKIPTFVSELIKTECVVHITKFEELLFLPIPFLTY